MYYMFIVEIIINIHFLWNNMTKQAPKTAKTAKKVGRKPSFATFVRTTSGGLYKYNKKINKILIKDPSWRVATEEGLLSRFTREYNEKYF